MAISWEPYLSPVPPVPDGAIDALEAGVGDHADRASPRHGSVQRPDAGPARSRSSCCRLAIAASPCPKDADATRSRVGGLP